MSQQGFISRPESTGPIMYLNIKDGKFVQNVKEGTPGAIRYQSKRSGKPYWLMVYTDTFAGQLTSVQLRFNTFGDEEVMLTLETPSIPGSPKVMIQFNMDSSHGRCFMQRMCNVNPGFDLTLKLYDYIPKAKEGYTPRYNNQGQIVPEIGMSLLQNDTKVPTWFTEDQLNGVPPKVPTIVNGKPTTDRTNRNNHLRVVMEQWATYFKIWLPPVPRQQTQQQNYPQNGYQQQPVQQPYYQQPQGQNQPYYQQPQPPVQPNQGFYQPPVTGNNYQQQPVQQPYYQPPAQQPMQQNTGRAPVYPPIQNQQPVQQPPVQPNQTTYYQPPVAIKAETLTPAQMAAQQNQPYQQQPAQPAGVFQSTVPSQQSQQDMSWVQQPAQQPNPIPTQFLADGNEGDDNLPF